MGVSQLTLGNIIFEITIFLNAINTLGITRRRTASRNYPRTSRARRRCFIDNIIMRASSAPS